MVDILEHYSLLIYFLFNRSKGDNYVKLREHYADIFIREIEEYLSLYDKKVLDVGGARGEFCKVLSEKRNCTATNLEPDPIEGTKYGASEVWPGTIEGKANSMPFDDNAFDVVCCRGVIEHIPHGEHNKSLEEMYRVLKKGGLLYIMLPPWYSFHGGHGLKPFHLLPFSVAKKLRKIFFKQEIDANSLSEMNLYPTTAHHLQKLVEETGFSIVDARDMHFRLHFIARIPGVREFLVPSIVFIAKK
jgi:ubiquinone/menaquinone biosynthesis C-methylase UbiE